MVFRADAGPEIGYGHLVRCTALASAFRAAGARPVFVTDAPHSLLQRAGFQYVVTQRGSEGRLNPARDRMALKGFSLEGRVPLVVDSYAVDSDYLVEMGTWFKPRVVLNDGGALLLGTDILLNGNIHAEGHSYPETGAELLLGADYCLIRPEFQPFLDIDRYRREVRSLLVMMGGSDPRNLTGWILQTLCHRFPQLQFTAVLGAGASDVVGQGASADNVTLLRDPADLSSVMAASDIAISAAGSTLYELAALGVPSLNIQVADNQTLVVRGAQAAGFSIGLGWPDTLSEEGLIAAVTALCTSPVKRLSMHRIGRKAIDGLGAVRTAARILAALRTAEGDEG